MLFTQFLAKEVGAGVTVGSESTLRTLSLALRDRNLIVKVRTSLVLYAAADNLVSYV